MATSQSNVPKVGIDCRLSGIEHAGIGRYEVELFSRVITNPNFQFVVYVYSTDQISALAVHLKDRAAVTWKVVPIKHYSLAEQLQLPWIFFKDTLDLLHVPHFNAPILYPRKTILTIHDLLWHQQRGSEVTTLSSWHYWIKHFLYLVVVRLVVRKASLILVPSMTIKTIVTDLLPFSAQKLQVTYEGVSPHFQPSTIVRKSKQLLYVGSLYPHKNIEVVLQALTQLPDYFLTIVSSRNAFSLAIQSRILQLNLQKRVEVIYKASDNAVLQLYQSCSAVIQPSHFEGFGLTGIEALACGAPLIASAIPIFKEIYGPYAYYFDPSSPQDCKRAILSAKKPLSKKQLPTFLARYNWNTTAEQTLAQYKKVISQLQ